MRRPDGSTPGWRIVRKPGIDFIITARMDGDTWKVLDYFLVPASAMATKVIYLRESRLERYSSWRFASINAMFGGATTHPTGAA
jgi:hypothetical protein